MPTTPRQRLTTSRQLFRSLAKIIFPHLGQPVTQLSLDALAGITFPPVARARATYRGYAITDYRAIAPNPIAPPPVRPYTVEQWRAGLDKVAQVTESGEYGRTEIDRDFIESAMVRADLHARTAERNQMIAFAVNDDDVAGWARIDPTPPTCPLCRITISRGPVYSSAQAAGGQGNEFHGGCTCTVVLVLKGQEDSWPGIEHFRREDAFYRANAKRTNGKTAAQSYRAAVMKENASVEGATKRAVTEAADREEP